MLFAGWKIDKQISGKTLTSSHIIFFILTPRCPKHCFRKMVESEHRNDLPQKVNMLSI